MEQLSEELLGKLVVLRSEEGLLEIEGSHRIFEVEEVLKQVEELHTCKKLPVVPQINLVISRHR